MYQLNSKITNLQGITWSSIEPDVYNPITNILRIFQGFFFDVEELKQYVPG